MKNLSFSLLHVPHRQMWCKQWKKTDANKNKSSLKQLWCSKLEVKWNKLHPVGWIRLTRGTSRAFSSLTILTVSPPHWVRVSPSTGSDSSCISVSAIVSWVKSSDCRKQRSSDRSKIEFVFKSFDCVFFFVPACLYLTAVCAARVLLYSDRTAQGS